MQGVGDFYAGMLHPMTSVECVVPIIALSLLAGQQGRRSAIGILVSFPLAIALGALLGLGYPAIPYIAVANTAAMVVLGILVASRCALSIYLSVWLSTVLGVAIGWVNGRELTPDTSPFRFTLGLALVGLLLVSYGIGLVRQLKAPWEQVGIRVVGSWIATVGILVLSLTK